MAEYGREGNWEHLWGNMEIGEEIGVGTLYAWNTQNFIIFVIYGDSINLVA